MRIMADHAFETATTWDDLVDAHAQWVADFNFQEHSARQDRTDGRRSPFHVLAWQRVNNLPIISTILTAQSK